MTSRWNALILAVGVALGACGSELPPQLPSSETRQRAATRVELVELVISDPARARKVRELYVRIDELMLRTKLAQAAQLLELGAEQPRTPDQTRELFRHFREAEADALKRYVDIQLEIRSLTSPEEFARLDAIK